MKSVEELTKRRYKCKAPYPNASRSIGEIIQADFATLLVDDSTEYDLSYYDNLFDLLPWHAERDVNDMPEYVRHIHSGIVAKSDWVKIDSCFFAKGIEAPFNSQLYLLPATEEDYQSSLK